MSSMRYITALAHIVTDSNGSSDLAEKVSQVFDCQDWDADDQDVTNEECEGFVEARVFITGFGLDDALSNFEEVLGEVASLENGSYGWLIVDGDWGIESFDCYGSAELVEAESVDADVVWSSEDYLDLSVEIKAEAWQELLECDTESLADEIESQSDDLLPMLVPESFIRACEDDGDVFFEYRDLEMPDEESEEESDEITVIFEFDGHDIRHETFEALVEALNGPEDELSAPEAKILLSLSSASEEDGAYENKLADADAPAMLIFESSWDGIGEVRILVPEVKGR